MERFAAWIALGLLVGFLLVVGLNRGPGDEDDTPPPAEAGTSQVASSTTAAATPTGATTTMPSMDSTATAVPTTVPEPRIVPAAAPLDEAYPSEWFNAIVAVSADEAWVPMGNGDSAGLIGHVADGDWTLYRLSPGGARVLGLAGAPDGTVWAATDVGAFAFDGEEWLRRFDDPVGGVAVAADGTVWIGGLRTDDPWVQDRLWLAKREGSVWRRVDPGPGEVPVPAGVAELAALPGEAWILHRAGAWIEDDVVRFDGSAWDIVEVAGIPDSTPGNGMPAVGVFGVEAAPGGAIWVAGYLAADPHEIVLARFDDGAWYREEWPFDDPLGVPVYVDTAVGPDGVIWFAFDGGLASFDGSAWFRHAEGVSVFGVAVASDGTVWFSDRNGIHTLVASSNPA